MVFIAECAQRDFVISVEDMSQSDTRIVAPSFKTGIVNKPLMTLIASVAGRRPSPLGGRV